MWDHHSILSLHLPFMSLPMVVCGRISASIGDPIPPKILVFVCMVYVSTECSLTGAVWKFQKGIEVPVQVSPSLSGHCSNLLAVHLK
ncbi:hypothetical protein AVEN_25417-1 [Araneus ventricosus]|uniref:Secreted protein n=1 Tax=Araneus ventricosus TaxID=182803 RepID=A0A4Y2I9Z8_ARAVE|nr:hypothetical protein AVEN_25417-1 [Araneus ventricosus]